MINARTFLGYPTDFQGICFIYPPLIKDLVSCDAFSVYQHILTISQEELYDLANDSPIEETPQFTISLELDANGVPKRPKPTITQVPTPLEYLLINSYNSNEFLTKLRKAFYFFTHTNIVPLYEAKAFYIGDIENFTEADYTNLNQLPLLTEENFLLFQNTIRLTLGQKQLVAMDLSEDPRILRMKAKARFRDQVKAKDGHGLNLESMLAAICCSNLGINPLNIGEISYGAVKALFEMSQNKEKYTLDIESLLAGADPHKVKPKHWITNLND